MEQGRGARLLVFGLTFLSYALYHAARKNLSGVKASISNDWLDNDTESSHHHKVIIPVVFLDLFLEIVRFL